MRRAILIAALAAFVAVCHDARPLADEGMWTFDRPPSSEIQQRYGFIVTRSWLDHLRLASVRFSSGGSGSFVSANGLVLTNHHVVRDQLQKLSDADNDRLAEGFYAPGPGDEIKLPDLELNVLMSSEDVSARVNVAVLNAATAQAALNARKAEIAQIERESVASTGLRSDVVALYQGAQYWLYRYKRFTDVRLVFAPEQQMAFFGGDRDNFTYPRYNLDIALVRVYDGGAPLHVDHFLRLNTVGAADNELVFVAGHPASTDRSDTIAEMETEREVVYPTNLKVLQRRLRLLRQYGAGGAEQVRQAAELTFSIENALKAYSGEYNGLRDARIMEKKAAAERALRDAVGGNAEWLRAFGSAWDDITKAEAARRRLYKPQRFGQIRGSTFADLGRLIVRYVTEARKPDRDRLDGFHEAQLSSLQFTLLSTARVYPALEEALLADALTESLEELGPSDRVIKAMLGGRTPAEAAARLIGETQLADPAVRKALLDGGVAAITRSTDPLIVLGRTIDPLLRELGQGMDREVTSIETVAREKIGRARFAVFGHSAYPDATLTLRLSYGTVKGYPMSGLQVPYTTTFAGLFDRSASFDLKPPYDLPAKFLEARGRLDLATPLNFVTTNDVIGGSSGSPVINRSGELVGVIFDNNTESLVGRYVYEEGTSRAVAVHSAAIVQALRAVYGASALADELTPQK